MQYSPLPEAAIRAALERLPTGRGQRPYGAADLSLRVTRRAIARLKGGVKHPDLYYIQRSIEVALDYEGLAREQFALAKAFAWGYCDQQYSPELDLVGRWLDRMISRFGPKATLMGILFAPEPNHRSSSEEDVLPDIDPREYGGEDQQDQPEPSEERRLHQVGTDEVRPQSDDPSDESPGARRKTRAAKKRAQTRLAPRLLPPSGRSRVRSREGRSPGIRRVRTTRTLGGLPAPTAATILTLRVRTRLGRRRRRPSPTRRS
jgi:hypothetical protein